MDGKEFKGTLHAGVQARGGAHGQRRAELAAVSKILGIADQTLHNWIKAEREGRLGGADSRPVSPE